MEKDKRLSIYAGPGLLDDHNIHCPAAGPLACVLRRKLCLVRIDTCTWLHQQAAHPLMTTINLGDLSCHLTQQGSGIGKQIDG